MTSSAVLTGTVVVLKGGKSTHEVGKRHLARNVVLVVMMHRASAFRTSDGTPHRGVRVMAVVGDGAAPTLEHGMHRPQERREIPVLIKGTQKSWMSESGRKSKYASIGTGTWVRRKAV